MEAATGSSNLPSQPPRLRNLDHASARVVDANARITEHSPRDPTSPAQQPEEEMLGADMSVTEIGRLLHRQLENLLGPGL